MGFVDAAAAAAKPFAEGYCGAVQLDSIVEAVDGGFVILVGAAVAVVIVARVLATELEALSAAADFERVTVPVLVAGLVFVAAAAIVGVLLVVGPAQV